MLPSFRDMHIHLDKTFYGGPWRPPRKRRRGIPGQIELERRLLPELLPTLEERAEMSALEAGRLLVVAYGRCQEAHGVARAVGLARRGEAWTPHDAAETTAWLADCGTARGA